MVTKCTNKISEVKVYLQLEFRNISDPHDKIAGKCEKLSSYSFNSQKK